MINNLRTNLHDTNADDVISPEELITQMGSDELQELLEEMGFEASEAMAGCIQNLVKQLGSLEAAINVLTQNEEAQRAA